MTPSNNHIDQKKRYRGAVFFPSSVVHRLRHRLTIFSLLTSSVSTDPATMSEGRSLFTQRETELARGAWEVIIP